MSAYLTVVFKSANFDQMVPLITQLPYGQKALGTNATVHGLSEGNLMGETDGAGSSKKLRISSTKAAPCCCNSPLEHFVALDPAGHGPMLMHRDAQGFSDDQVQADYLLFLAGYRTAAAPTGAEHRPMLERLLAKLMSAGLDAAEKCEAELKHEGYSQADAEGTCGQILRAFAIAKLELAKLLEPDLLSEADPLNLATNAKACNKALTEALPPARTMHARVLEADFEKSTLLMEVSGLMVFGAGGYAITAKGGQP